MTGRYQAVLFDLTARWDELQPWPEVLDVLSVLGGTVALGVVTNCSHDLGTRAAALLPVPVDVLISGAGRCVQAPPGAVPAGPRRPWVPAERTLFVAGSRYDIAGPGGVGMPVWWHNRARLSRGDLATPFAEHDSLTPLPADVLGPRQVTSSGRVSARRPPGTWR